MNPGLVVKLRPAGPWRIGPDSGARNRVDVIFHSDSLYSAVTSAMLRLGSLDEWLDATARNPRPAVSFSSCFPFLDEIGFVVPPRTLWPPQSPALMSARVRWKSARFVPLGVVQSMVRGEKIHEAQWAVDGPSECLVPAGSHGPFRIGVRFNAAVDRLSGASERHSAACIEFRPGAGLWTVVSFADDAAHTRWLDPVKAAFRLLADSGVGGERSRGWGRAGQPEFIEGTLPDMLLAPPAEKPPAAHEPVEETTPVTPTREAATEPAPAVEEPPVPEPENPPVEEPSPAPPMEDPPPEESPEDTEHAAVHEPLDAQHLTVEPSPDPEAEPAAAEPTAAEPEPAGPGQGHWLLSLYTPGASDRVDWRRGNYTVLARGGRIESPVASGELKKQVQMITEGSVVYAASEPCGSAADVAPDGFAHPVFRAGFAVSIPLPEVG